MSKIPRGARVLLVSTWLPQQTVQGTSMRVYRLLELMWQRYASVTLVLAADFSADDSRIASLQAAFPTLEIRIVQASLPRLTQRQELVSIITGTDWGLILVFRTETAHLLCGIRQSEETPWWLDIDEVASRRELMMSTLAKTQGDEQIAEHHCRLALAYRWAEKIEHHRYQRLFVCSKQEAELLAETDYAARVQVLPHVYPATEPLPSRIRGPIFRMLFVGTLNYAPNDDAIRWLADELAPEIRRRLGTDLEFAIAGSSPGVALSETMSAAGFHYLGFVPDLRPVYESADVVLVPLRYGTGSRLKILEAFAFGRPVVSSTIGADGLDIEAGKMLLIADDANAFADALQALFEASERGRSLVDEGLQFVRSRHSISALDRLWDGIQ